MTKGTVSHQFGQTSERLAEQFLVSKGYRIVERNLRTSLGELDLVAEDGHVLVFVEVKARTTDAFGGVRLAVDHRKQHKLIQLASQYIAQKHLSDKVCRFDVVLVHGDSSSNRQVEHLENAFEVVDR